MLARAEALQPLLREHAVVAEADRRLPDEVVTRLSEAGLFRMLTPCRLDGCETRLRTVVAVTETLGVADGSAAWLVALSTAHAWMAGLFSERAQQDIFGADPDAVIAGRIARVAGGGDDARAEPVDGGVRINGRFAYASGSHHAKWLLLGATAVDEVSQIADLLICLAPTSELHLEDTWHTVGLRGTGSNTWIAEDHFVPEHRLISTRAMSDGMRVRRRTDEPMYRLPVMAVATLTLLGPILGLDEAALRLAVDKAPTRPLSDTIYHPKSQSVGIQVQVAEAALMLQTARLHAFQIADELDCCAATGQTVDYRARARMRAQSGHRCRQVIEAIDLLLNVHGAESFARDQPHAAALARRQHRGTSRGSQSPSWDLRSSGERCSASTKRSARSCDFGAPSGAPRTKARRNRWAHRNYLRGTSVMPNRSPSRSTSTARDAREVLDRVNALGPILRARAAETEKLRRMRPDTLRDLTEAGVLRLTVPADVGGYEADDELVIEVLAQISRGCPSTGWICCIAMVSNMLARADER